MSGWPSLNSNISMILNSTNLDAESETFAMPIWISDSEQFLCAVTNQEFSDADPGLFYNGCFAAAGLSEFVSNVSCRVICSFKND